MLKCTNILHLILWKIRTQCNGFNNNYELNATKTVWYMFKTAFNNPRTTTQLCYVPIKQYSVYIHACNDTKSRNLRGNSFSTILHIFVLYPLRSNGYDNNEHEKECTMVFLHHVSMFHPFILALGINSPVIHYRISHRHIWLKWSWLNNATLWD